MMDEKGKSIYRQHAGFARLICAIVVSREVEI